jgi:transposase
MNIFLSRLAMGLKQNRCILIIDGAPWHRSQGLKTPANVEIIYLPPYPPELNPVEKFWNCLKSHNIKNKFYTSIANLEGEVCNFLADLSRDTIKSICSCSYL